MKNSLCKCVKAAGLLLLIGCQLSLSAQTTDLPMATGKFKASDESLQQYQCPEWFRDAKFGLWAHWGPQAVPRLGDWYAKRIYIQEDVKWRTTESTGKPHPDYTSHLAQYGHPSEFGYKDIIPLWKAERWKPDELMKLYKRAGAKYFVSMATHHDNFFLWDSKLHRWNSVQMGPKKDVVGLWQKAAKKEGLHFGVSEHLAASYTWFQTSHGADKVGDKAGVPYDGNDPRYQDLYHEKAAPDDTGWLTKNPKWQREWYDRIKELVDMYQPELLYSDCGVPFGEVGRSLIAHYYNQSLNKKGQPTVVYTCKEESNGRFARDVEKGVIEGISPYPWQTDTTIGGWFYQTGQKYRTANEIIQMLIDIVSKNGNLLLNVVQTPEGDLETEVVHILENIATWIADNGEAIYGTRPWRVYGEGPSLSITQEKGDFGGLKDVRRYQSGDIRFTTKGGVLYAFCMEHPEGKIQIKSLGKALDGVKKVSSVKLLGSKEKLAWSQSQEELLIQQPLQLPLYSALALEIKFEKG